MANSQRRTAGAVIQGSFVGGRFTPPGVPAPAAPGRATNPHINQHSAHVRQIVQAKMAQPRAAAPRAAQARGVRSQSPVVQRHGTGEAFQLPSQLSNFGGGSGQPLPAAVLQKMESFFGTSFGDIRVHVGPQASAIGALAFTHGSNLYFAQGQYNPNTTRGQQILAHELTHVVQQRAGRVRNPFGSGVAVVNDRSMEAEAERMGHLAALHKEKSSAPVASAPTGANRGTGQDAVQPMLWAVGVGVALGVGALAYCLRGRNEREEDEELNDGGDAGGGGGGGGGGDEGKGKAKGKGAKRGNKPGKSPGPSPLELLKREARQEGAERTSRGWPIYEREIRARLASHGKGADKVVREAFMEGATAASRSAPAAKPFRVAPRRPGGGGGGGGLSDEDRADQVVDTLLARLRGAIGRYEVYSKKDANVARQGCVKNGPSEFVHRDLKALVYATLVGMEGDEFEGGRLHVVKYGKNPPHTYNLTLHGDYMAHNPRTMAILHVES